MDVAPAHLDWCHLCSRIALGKLPRCLSSDPALISARLLSQWLVRQGRTGDAVKVVQRLTSPRNTDFDADKAVALMVHTNALEKSISAGTSYLDCFKGTDRRRTEITCITWMIQNWSGAAFMGYSTYFLTKAGFATEKAFDMSLGQCESRRLVAALPISQC